MKLAHKIYAVIGIFVLPLGALALYFVVTGINKDIYEFAEKEMMGNEYQRQLEHLLEHISQHQLLAQRSVNDASIQGRMTEVKAQINRDFDSLAEVDGRLGRTLLFTREGLAERRRENANVSFVRQAWNALASQQNLELTVSRAKHFELITLIRSMIDHSGDKSNLILDPDLDSYYLMDMTLVRLPVNQERIAIALSFGAEVLARGEPTPLETRQFDTHAAMLREADRDCIVRDMNTSLDEDKNFKGISETLKSMQPKVDVFAASMTEFAEVLEKISERRGPMGGGLDQKQFIASGEKAQRASFELWDAAANELDTLLRIRRAYKQQERTVALLLTAAILIFAGFVSFFVIRTISRSVEKVSGQLHELAEGEADLTRRIAVAGSLELQQLALAFNTLMGKLRELIKQVQQSGTQVTSSSTEIAASTKQLEAAVTEQAASTNEVVATTKEISATSQTLVQTMSDIGKVATGTANLASTAQGDLDGMESTMRGLAGSTTSISTKLAAINDKASNINKIVITITKVADQTNLLSLNASIEAEKAGEHGLGFAVVAREIRRLADQTAVATLDIERMVKEMQSAVSVGVMEMDKFTKDVGHGVEEVNQISTQLTKIMEQVQTLAPRFDTVTEGMQAQSQGAQQISSAMVQLSEAARQTMDSLKQTNAAIMDLNSAARGLHAEVSRFRTGE